MENLDIYEFVKERLKNLNGYGLSERIMPKLNVKKIQRSGNATNFLLISKEAMKKLKLKAQDEECQMVEIVKPPDTLIFKRV